MIFLLSYPAYEFVACFVLWNWMDVNMNKIILGLHPTRGSSNNVCLVANAWYNCSTRHDMRSECGISAQERPSRKRQQILYNFEPAGPADHDSGPPVGSCKLAKDGSAGRIRGSNLRVSRKQLAGHGDPTRD